MPEREKPTLHVEFFTRPIENVKRTKAEGRPIFEDREMIRVRFAGDRNRTFEAFADQRGLRDRGNNEWVTYAERFSDHYAAFKKGQQYLGDGTPLAELPFLTESKRAELRALNIHTAEALAEMEGTPLRQLGMGGRELKNQAAAWIQKAAGSADMTRMAAENAALAEQLEALRQQVAELAVRPGVAPSVPVMAPSPASAFTSWSAEEIKAWIAQQTGARPKGNPNHATLVQMADDLAAKPALPLPAEQAAA